MRIFTRKPLVITESAGLFFSIPKSQIPALVDEYVGKMETEESAGWCRCQWIVHPEDVKVTSGFCRECFASKDSPVHKPADERYHPYFGKRMRRGDQDATCPVHTREGMIMYFFEWALTDAAQR